MGRPGGAAARLALAIAAICAAGAVPSDQRGRVRFSPSQPMGLPVGVTAGAGTSRLTADGTSRQPRGPGPGAPRPNGDPNQNNRPDGPGPCGSPSDCETWVTSNPLAGLDPLPKIHYSFAFDPGYLDKAHANASCPERALLVDMARIMGSISFSVANNSVSVAMPCLAIGATLTRRPAANTHRTPPTAPAPSWRSQPRQARPTAPGRQC